MKVLRWTKKLIGLAWRYSLILTLPAAVAYLFWAVNVGTRFWDFGIRYGDHVGNPDLHEGGRYEWARMKSAMRIALFEEGAEEDADLRQVHLMFNQGSEAKLNQHLPSSGREYQEGYLFYPDGVIRPVDMRYRGDFAWHWATHKKSWRVKTSRDAMWNNMRSFNLIVPKGAAMVEDYLGYWLATEMQLLAPETDMVEVLINGKTRGVHTMVEQLEELVLRKNDRMPGDLYAGELIGRDAHEGIINWVFDHPGLWEKVAINNHFLEEDYPDQQYEALRHLCELLAAPPSDENAKALTSILNMEAWGRFAAYRVLTQSKHFDRTHNWRLYYDPWKCKFEPVVWDTVPWHRDWMPRPGAQPFREPLFSRLDDRLALIHPYRKALDEALHEFFTSGLRGRLMEEFDRMVELTKGALRRDPVLTYKLNFVEPEEVFRYQQEIRSRMQRLFEQLEEEHVDLPPLMRVATLEESSTTANWRLALYGRRGIDGLRIEFEKPLDQIPAVQISVQADGEVRQVDLSSACTLAGRYLDIKVPLMGGMVYRPNPESKNFADRGEMMLTTASYDLSIMPTGASLPKALRLEALLPGGEPTEIVAAAELPLYPVEGQYGALPQSGKREALIWEGEMTLSGQQILQDSVMIRPGTTIRMEPDASVVIEGTVIAAGTAEQPIRVIPAREGAPPWGTFTIRGPKADGSVFRHVQFIGGSGWKQPLAEFSSMFSVHWVQRVTVDHCLFQDSYVVDDMVHGVYSDVDFLNCVFRRSLADALDMDISRTVVRDCLFEESGNDSVDLMTSTALVENTQYLNSGDKGISIGENSTLVVRNSLFDGCMIALQSKDESQAAVVNSDILRCRQWGVDAYKKNWRYNGGGEIYIYKSRFVDNEVPLRADRHSLVGIADSYVDNLHQTWQPHFLQGRGMRQDPASASGIPANKSYRFPREVELLAPLGTQVWSRVNTKERGSTFVSFP